MTASITHLSFQASNQLATNAAVRILGLEPTDVRILIASQLCGQGASKYVSMLTPPSAGLGTNTELPGDLSPASVARLLGKDQQQKC